MLAKLPGGAADQLRLLIEHQAGRTGGAPVDGEDHAASLGAANGWKFSRIFQDFFHGSCRPFALPGR